MLIARLKLLYSPVRIRVNYALSHLEMVGAFKKAIGSGWIHSDATPEHFPIQGTGIVDLEFLRFVTADQDLDFDDCANELHDYWKVQQAMLEHMLAFGTAYPVQFRDRIYALGRVWTDSDDRRQVICADQYNCEYGLNLRWHGQGLDRFGMVAAVRPV